MLGEPCGGRPAAVEFFEKSVRPMLAARCQECHGPTKQKGGLRLDARAAIVAGGESGPAVVPGDARASLLIDAINYGEDHQMPPKSKLPAPEIATLTRWVEMGAPGEPKRHPAARRRALRRISSRYSASGLDTGRSSPSGGSRRRRYRKPATGRETRSIASSSPGSPGPI